MSGTLADPINVDPGTSPLYQSSDLAVADKTQKEVVNNADSIRNIQVSGVVNPSPNTLVPLDNTGKLPVSIIPSSGGWTQVSSQTVTSQSTVTISGLTSPKTYKIMIDLGWVGTSGNLQLRFNGDSGANYTWNMGGITTAGNFSYGTGATGATQATLGDTGNLNTAGNPIMMTLTFSGNPGSSSNMVAAYWDSWQGSTPMRAFGGCKYSGSATLSSVTVLSSAGTFTGIITVLSL